MTYLQALADRLRHMPAEKQREVLDFADFLLVWEPRTRPIRSVGGACEDLGVSLPAQQLDELRAEMWAGFPRSDG